MPPGLGQPSAALESLVKFLRIDYNLLHVAARSSPQIERVEFHQGKIMEWVARLPAQEKDELIATLIVDDDHSAVSALLQRFLREHSACTLSDPPSRRTVGDLLQAAEVYFEERKRLEADKRAKEKARCEREAAIAREKHLDSLVGQESKLWAKVESLISTKQPKNYDLTVKVLLDLRDIDLRTQGGDFHRHLEALRQGHAHKPSFLLRLEKAGL